MKVAVVNLGCKVNQCECDSIAAAFQRLGYEVSEELSIADIYVINTCAVTAEAEKKSRQCVARVRKYNPDAKIYVVGCASQNNPAQFADKNVDFVGGTADKMDVCGLPTGQNVKEIPASFEPLIIGEGERARGNVKVQDGCNNYCSYCLVPYLRGRARSRALEDVVAECAVKANTHAELVLTGINTAAYGLDLGLSLVDLVKALSVIPARFRFGSLEANVITDELLAAMKEAGNFCDHFHLSLQSGDDETLRAMNRHYTTAEFARKVALIRAYFPLAAVTTDVIVGFPTETAEQFDRSLAFVREMEFANLHVFPYSRRKGTKAYVLPPVAPEEMQRRVGQMNALKNELATAFVHSFIGYTLETATERADDMYMQGHTSNYIKVYIPLHHACKPNSVYTVRCLSPYMDGVLAEIV